MSKITIESNDIEIDIYNHKNRKPSRLIELSIFLALIILVEIIYINFLIS